MDKTGTLKAVGAITTYSAVIYPLYYNVTIGWSLVYLITGFISPLPYSANNEGFVDKCGDSVSGARCLR
jgi:SNF family Na+-dependent transporter